MSDKILCVLAGYDEQTERHLSQMQNCLYEAGFVGRHTKNLLQHITLGTFSTDQESQLIDIITNTCKQYKAFPVTFSHIGIFTGSQVLFVAPDASKQMLDLKELFGDSLKWAPHTTMLIDDQDKILDALPILLNQFESFSGQVVSLHLYEFWPTRHICSIDLLK